MSNIRIEDGWLIVKLPDGSYARFPNDLMIHAVVNLLAKDKEQAENILKDIKEMENEKQNKQQIT